LIIIIQQKSLDRAVCMLTEIALFAILCFTPLDDVFMTTIRTTHWN